MKTEEISTKAVKLLTKLLRIRVNKLSEEIETNTKNSPQSIFDNHFEGINECLVCLQKASLIAKYPKKIGLWKGFQEKDLDDLLKDVEESLIKLIGEM